MEGLDVQSLITTLGGTTVAVGAVAWLARELLKAGMSKDLERFKAELQAASQQRLVSFSSLHAKRAEVVARLHELAVDIQQAMYGLQFQLNFRTIREQTDALMRTTELAPWNIRPGIDTLTPDEEKAEKEFSKAVRAFGDYYSKHRIYFSEDVVSQLTRMMQIAIVLSHNYSNVAIKNSDGTLKVIEDVKTVWDASMDTLPRLIETLEREFRQLLGVEGHAP